MCSTYNTRRMWRIKSAAVAIAAMSGNLLVGGPMTLEPPLGLDAFMPIPAENPLTTEKVTLGKMLFADPVLSRDRSVACSTCHLPEQAFTDELPNAKGVFGRIGPRRVPKLINRGYGRSFFWDGRIATLEEQVLQPVINSLEMDLTLPEAVARLQADQRYVAEFQNAFGDEPNQEDLARALASYVRTVLSGDSPYDRYVAGDPGALNEEERLGLQVFRTKGNCLTCHMGPNLTDERFHNTGVAYKEGEFVDDGRFVATKRPQDRGAFKTPTLRDVALTPPYMHDGSLRTLEDVIDDYDKGGTPNPNLDPEISELRLTDKEKAALVAFLKALTGKLQEGL